MSRRSATVNLNRTLAVAAALFERGDDTQAAMALDELLKADPGYPLRSCLKEILRKNGRQPTSATNSRCRI